MAESAVDFLLENLKELIIYHTDLLRDARSSIQKLENDLRLLRAFLKDTNRKRRSQETVELVRQIRDVVYEAEDAIDVFVADSTAVSTSKLSFLRRSKMSPTLHRVTERVEQAIAKVRQIYDSTQLLDMDSYSAKDEYKNVQVIRQDNVVGFEEDAHLLIKYLIEETEHLDIITIVGMSGLGKTTLAGKVFRDPEIQYEFPIRIWVHVSEEFTMKDVLLNILKHLTQLSEHMYGKSTPELVQQVAQLLEREKFLIVLDDVWTIDDWNKLQLALPLSNRRGKVLMTSCKEDVGRFANYSRVPYKLRFLTHEESWRMLQWEVFGKHDCPVEFEDLGRLIAEQCGGLPAAIMVMGGIIAMEYSKQTTMRAKMDAWREGLKSVHIHLNARFYNDLPDHLKTCFLYFGMFPEDYEIPAWRLKRMWIAEGFVQENEGLSSEENAEKYLEDLINRSLVMVEKRKGDGRIKTCRIHGALRDFCKFEAGKERENILQEIRQSNDASFDPPLSQELRHRRLCIHSNVLDFLSSRPYGPRVRSFVSFSREVVNLPTECSAAIPLAFKLLRVLDVKPIKFSKIHRDMYQLVHLRYMVLSLNTKVLRPAFVKLWYLQTLEVNTTSPTLEIQADIWKLRNLRHFKTNASATLPRIGKSSSGKESQLQTFGAISPESCTEDFFRRARNLKKLGIRGRLSLLLGTTEFPDGFEVLSNLQKLKLANVTLDEGNSLGMHIPPPYKFPPGLRSLTLVHTGLDWKEMSILGMLEKLEVLKLKDKAFIGSKWEVADGGFRCLEVLHIEKADLVVWQASGHHFPRLRHLNLHNCEKLEEVPIGLADIPTLQHLHLYNTYLAAASARGILEQKKKILDDESIKLGVFKLSVSPHSE